MARLDRGNYGLYGNTGVLKSSKSLRSGMIDFSVSVNPRLDAIPSRERKRVRDVRCV